MAFTKDQGEDLHKWWGANSPMEWFSETDPETGFSVIGYRCEFTLRFREEVDVSGEATYEIVKPKLLEDGRGEGV